MASTKPNKPFFDANVLLELLLARDGFATVKKIQESLDADEILISALTGHLVAHFRPVGISLKTTKLFLNDYMMVALTKDDFIWAFDAVRDADFEDALQLAVAVRSGCDIFYTFDKDLADNYANLPTLTVQHLM